MIIPTLLTAMVLFTGAPQSDDDPRTAIEGYFQAHAFGKGELIKQVFTPDARIMFVEGGEFTQ